MSDFSVHAVLSNDDIMCDILLRLPPETIFKLILVSKRLLQVICGSYFRHAYLTKWKPSFHLVGFFICNTLYLGRRRDSARRPHSEAALPLLSTSGEGDDLEAFGALKRLGYYIDSSNGVLLCGRHPKAYYVWDPDTRKSHQLPRPRVHSEELCMAFITEECPFEGISYKVIRAKCQCRLDETKTVCIETYSSKTTTWSFSILSCQHPLSLSPWTFGRVINGVVHWYAAGGNIAIYDTNDEEKRIELVKLPSSFNYDEQALGETSDGHLQYGCSTKSGMEIWVLEKERFGLSEPVYQWNIIYKLSFKLMWRRNPTLATRFSTRTKETQLLAFIHRNSDSVFIRSDSHIFTYNSGTQTVEEVQYQGRASSFVWDFCKVVPYFRRVWPRSSLCESRNHI
ncbi:PREDICTED: F-box protein At5g03970 [Tarenaya hassleriana]|uniref:F-box protein At5g03970 n=1 Tax=Tarenaya hassleriana TaxID=28532 RepID=UPI00053C2101|nr:PREDICTED: F-box protein At5g03970 [Tarenaya hassleriana]